MNTTLLLMMRRNMTFDDTFGYISGIEPDSWKLRIQTTDVNQAFIVTLDSPSSINIDWGDGVVEAFTTAGDKSHTYANSGNHILSITGSLINGGNIRFDNATTRSRLKATGVPYNIQGMTTNAFKYAFGYCTGLTSIPNDFGRYNTNMTSQAYYNTFNGCTELTSIPVDFGKYNTLMTYGAYYQTFKGCTRLTSIPTDFGRYNTSITSSAYFETFGGCTNLISIPTDFGRYNTNMTTDAFKITFSGDINLDGNAPTLWTLYPDTTNGTGCFHNCTELDNYASIPIEWK